MRRLGALQDIFDTRDYKLRDHVTQSVAPDVIDYERGMSSVKNQGKRGACVAFVGAAIKEWQEEIDNLSEEWIYRIIAQPGGGAFPRDLFKALARYGVCRERRMRYSRWKKDIGIYYDLSLSLPSAVRHRIMRKMRRTMGEARQYRGGKYIRIHTIDEMREALAHSGPLFMALPWRSAWGVERITYLPTLSWNSGSVIGRHGVTIVGHDSHGRVKFKNSWGKKYGRKGYAYFHPDIFKHMASLDIWALYDANNPLLK